MTPSCSDGSKVVAGHLHKAAAAGGVAALNTLHSLPAGLRGCGVFRHQLTSYLADIILAYVIGQDGTAMLWDLAEGKRLYSLEAGDIIHSLCFSPNRLGCCWTVPWWRSCCCC